MPPPDPQQSEVDEILALPGMDEQKRRLMVLYNETVTEVERLRTALVEIRGRCAPSSPHEGASERAYHVARRALTTPGKGSSDG